MGVEIFRIKKLDSVLYKMICNFVYFFILKEILFGFVGLIFFFIYGVFFRKYRKSMERFYKYGGNGWKFL